VFSNRVNLSADLCRALCLKAFCLFEGIPDSFYGRVRGPQLSGIGFVPWNLGINVPHPKELVVHKFHEGLQFFHRHLD
jgi:hypothetical protein